MGQASMTCTVHKAAGAFARPAVGTCAALPPRKPFCGCPQKQFELRDRNSSIAAANEDSQDASDARETSRPTTNPFLDQYSDEETEASVSSVINDGVETHETETEAMQTIHSYVGQDASFALSVGIPPPLPEPGAGGLVKGDGFWVWAVAILVALRLGRVGTEDNRYFFRRQQLVSNGPRSASKELLERRKAYRAAQSRSKVQESAERIAAAKGRAAKLERQKADDQRRYQEAAAKEAQKLKQHMEEQRKAYEEREAQLRAEFERRVAQEQAIREEAAARARAKEEEQRRIEAERKRKVEEERRQREEAELKARQEEIERKLEEKRQLAKLQKTFAVTVEGAVKVEKAPKRAETSDGPFAKAASVKLEVTCGTLMGGATEPTTQLYASIQDARESVIGLTGRAARGVIDSYASAARLQKMVDQGPLTFLDDLEFRHWLNIAAAQSCVVMAHEMGGALDLYVSDRQKADKSRAVKLRCDWSALSVDHPASLPSRIDGAIGLIEQGNSDTARDTILQDLIQDEQEHFKKALGRCPAPPFVSTALVLAHLLDRMLEGRPAKQVDAPAWFESAAAVMRDMLKEATRDAPKDSLTPICAYVTAALGPEHPVAKTMADLAERNLSKATREAREEKKKLVEAEFAARLLEEQWPDYRELAAARIADQDAQTPVPERVWALRNVARTLAMGGPGERARARKLLEQAVGLKQAWCGGPDHPGALPELLALLNVLRSVPEWQADAVQPAEAAMKLLANVAERYRSTGDVASAVALLECSVREFEDVLGYRHASISSASRRAEQLMELLSPEERQKVSEVRRDSGGVIPGLSGMMTEDLAVYATPGSATKKDMWDQGGKGPLAPLVT